MHHRIDILFITSRADLGGGPKHLNDLSRNLTDINIHIAAPDNHYYSNLFRRTSKSFLSIPHRKLSMMTFLRLLTFCKRKNIRTIHSHGRGGGLYSRLLALFGLRVIHTCHGIHYKRTLKDTLLLAIERSLKHLTEHFIFVSPSEKNKAIDLGICHSAHTIIPNGIEEEDFKDTEPVTDTKILGTISRLDSHKNNLELIKFLREMPDYTLYIAGDGEEIELLKNVASSNVHFLGPIIRPHELLSKINTYVSASKGEGLPYSLLEAIAAKKNILVSNVIGHNDLLEEKNMYKQGSLESFKEKLKNISSIPFNKKYTIQSMVEKTKSILLNRPANIIESKSISKKPLIFTSKKYAFIINSYGRDEATLRRCLDSITSQITDECSVFFINQNNYNPFPLSYNNCFTTLNLRTKSISRARNIALSIEKAQWYIFVDDDAYLDCHYVKSLIDETNRPNGPGLISGTIKCINDKNLIYSQRQKHSGIIRNFLQTKKIMGGNIIVKANIFKNLGGFDERFGVGSTWPSSEDTDFSWKCYFYGHQLELNKKLVLYHPPASQISSEKAYQYGLGKGALTKKWFNTGNIIILLEILEMIIVPIAKSFSTPFLKTHLMSLRGRIKGLFLY